MPVSVLTSVFMASTTLIIPIMLIPFLKSLFIAMIIPMIMYSAGFIRTERITLYAISIYLDLRRKFDRNIVQKISSRIRQVKEVLHSTLITTGLRSSVHDVYITGLSAFVVCRGRIWNAAKLDLEPKIPDQLDITKLVGVQLKLPVESDYVFYVVKVKWMGYTWKAVLENTDDVAKLKYLAVKTYDVDNKPCINVKEVVVGPVNTSPQPFVDATDIIKDFAGPYGRFYHGIGVTLTLKTLWAAVLTELGIDRITLNEKIEQQEGLDDERGPRGSENAIYFRDYNSLVRIAKEVDEYSSEQAIDVFTR